MNVAFLISNAGDKLGSEELISTLSVNDLFFGKLESLSVSFTFDATNLGVGKNIVSFNIAGSNPWSMNEDSLPSALVPLIVLIDDVTRVKLPGVITLNCGDILYWIDDFVKS